MNLNFESITIEKQDEYIRLLSECPQKASDYSFVNIWGWADEYGLLWAWKDNLVWIKQTIPESVYWAPVGNWEAHNWNACFKNLQEKMSFIRVPEQLKNIWEKDLKRNVTVEEARAHWDYLYSIAELVELSGNRFHKKKNLLNQFKKYDHKYIDFSAELVEQALAMQEDWCVWRDCESSEVLSAENKAIVKVLKNWKSLKGLMGGALLVENVIVAYTVAEALSENEVVIHFEKGCTAHKGVYQAINQIFLENLKKDFTLVNREQDLDDEGLRKAKLSYNPVDFLKKYRVVIS